MPRPRRATRRGLVAATVLLLASGAACSPDPDPAPPPGPVSTPAATAEPGPTTAPATTPAPGPTRTPSATQPPPATTPVPPPSPGSVDSTVPAEPEESRPPVELDKPSETGTGLTARLVSIKAVSAEAQLPGEVAGPALAITVEVNNTGAKPADISSVVVNVLDADEAPATEMSTEPSDPFSGRVGAKKKARAVYVFTVPTDKRRPVTVTMSIRDAPVLVFTGNAPSR